MATVFSLRDPNPGVWFKFDETDPESGEIRIRAMNNEQRKKLQKECNKKRVEYKHGQRFEVTDVNDDKFSELLWDYWIVEWNGLEDDDRTPLLCGPETKAKLMQTNVGFAQFVGKCLELLAEQEEERVARIEKNLLSEPKGSKKSPVVKDAVK